MPNRRRAAVLTVIAIAGTVLLAGCTKPLPEVALYANGQTVSTGPSVFCYPGQSFEANNCVTQRLDAPQVTMETLDRISVDVPVEIAKNGFVVEVGGRTAGGIHTETYFSVPLSLQEGQQTTVRVLALSSPSTEAQITGVWQFSLLSQA